MTNFVASDSKRPLSIEKGWILLAWKLGCDRKPMKKHLYHLFFKPCKVGFMGGTLWIQKWCLESPHICPKEQHPGTLFLAGNVPGIYWMWRRKGGSNPKMMKWFYIMKKVGFKPSNMGIWEVSTWDMMGFYLSSISTWRFLSKWFSLQKFVQHPKKMPFEVGNLERLPWPATKVAVASNGLLSTRSAHEAVCLAWPWLFFDPKLKKGAV